MQTDCRFIGTSQGDIREKVRGNVFREDLYYRLNVILIHLPPLRDRPEDIKPLLCTMATRLGANPGQFIDNLQSRGLLEYFEKYPWPGNVKELQRVVEMALLTERWDEIKRHLLGHSGHSSRRVIERYIEFPPEYCQAGISILSFFGEVLRRKYPDKQATVRIEQDGLRVKMMVEPFIGEPEIFQRALDQYGLVVLGRITPEEFTNDPLLVFSLKHELRMLQAKLEGQKELLQVYERNDGRKDSQIIKLTEMLEKAFSPTQPNPVSITVSPVITSSVNVQLGISNAIEDICRDLKDLSMAIGSSCDAASSIEEVRQDVEKLKGSVPDKVKGSSGINKLEQFLKQLSDAESTIVKAVSITERGFAIAQRLAGHYNDVAQWLGLPQIPKPFLGKG